MDALSFDPVAQLVQLLTDAGVPSSTDPGDLNVPAAWVNVEGIRVLTVGGALQLEAVVYLIAPDGDYALAYSELAKLYNLMTTVLQPDGLVVPQGVVLPDSPTPLPALRVPVNLT